MSSAAYQRASAAPAAADPDNRLLAYFPRRRLTAEEMRDSLLSASGQLDLTPAEAHPFPAEATWKFTQHNPLNAVYETTKRSAYLNGELGNNNIHSLDICRWGLGMTGLGRSVLSYGGRLGYTDAAETPNSQVGIFDFGDKTIITETRGLKTAPYHPTIKAMWFFYGSEGIIADTSLFDPKGNLIRAFEGKTENHFANFLKAVRSRKVTDLTADIAEGHQSTALCHIANISYRLGAQTPVNEISKALGNIKAHEDVQDTLARTRHYLSGAGVDLDKVKVTLGQHLRIDGDKEAFLDIAAANALLTREYRKPFVVPSEAEI